MKLLHVIPIARKIGGVTLSYYGSKPVPHGSVIFVPLRNKEVPALVIASDDVKDAKAQIKSAKFAMKKIRAQKPLTLVTPQCVEAAQETARWFATTTESVLRAILPVAILSHVEKIQNTLVPPAQKTTTVNEKLVLQAPPLDRLQTYKSLIREEFARNASVFLCVPTIAESVWIAEQLQKGIEHHTFLLHSALSKKEKIARWKKAQSAKRPVLIVATGGFLALPRHDLGTIIIEREQSSAYTLIARPYLDVRVFAEFLTRHIRARLILADTVLRTETIWHHREGHYDELEPLKLRISTTIQQSIVDMRTPIEKKPKVKEYNKGDSFEILSSEIKKTISTLPQSKEHLFIYATRRGLAPTTVCSDCNTTVTCNICNAPVVLYKKSEENIFVCHTCGISRSAKEVCTACRGWKLVSLGIGIQRVEESIKKMFPEQEPFVVHKDVTKTHVQIEQVVQKFYKKPGSILLGTEMVIPYLHKPISHTAVSSIDSLLSVPEWRISEKIFSLLLAMRYLSTTSFIIQTRKPEYQTLEYAMRGNVNDFYRGEIAARKKFNYPPFSILIKITVTGSAQKITSDMKKIEKLFDAYAFHVYEPRTPFSGGRFAMHGLIRVPNTLWPDEKLLSLLRRLPPHISINVDPENLF